jgi:hypothetical protein
MTVQTTASRPAGKSVGAAGVGVIVTLLIFVLVFVTFLVAPLIALLLAYLGYTVMRPRAGRTETTGPAGATHHPAHGFGSGTQ